jgi:hypothetical protein
MNSGPCFAEAVATKNHRLAALGDSSAQTSLAMHQSGQILLLLIGDARVQHRVYFDAGASA